MIYFDHAATTPMRQEVLQSMLPFLNGLAANPSALYMQAREMHQAVDRARGEVADLIGAKPQEIYFTSGGSESDNWALFGCLRAVRERGHIITSAIEHHAILNACSALEKLGCEVSVVGVDDKGCVDPQWIADAIRPNTALISVMLANNEVGTIQPIEEIVAIAHAHGILMHTDAVQAVGHIPIDVKQIGVDLLSLSAHKFGGPKGIGALYICGGVRISPLIYGGEQERGLRAGTENIPGIVGLGCAAALAKRELSGSVKRTEELRNFFMQEILQNIPQVRINGSLTDRLPGNLHVTFPQANTNVLLMRLDMAGIAASAGSACAAGAVERSHVLKAMQVPDGADIRFTLNSDNTKDEIVQTVKTLVQILG